MLVKAAAETTNHDVSQLMREVERYLEVVEFFRQQGCDPRPRDFGSASAWWEELL